jgi:hypothetical protein
MAARGEARGRVCKPYQVIEQANGTDLEALRGAVDVHAALEDGDSAAYWGHLMKLCDLRLTRLRASEEAEAAHAKTYSLLGIQSDLLADAEAILQDKTEAELKTMHRDIQASLNDPDRAIDREYWTGMLALVEHYRAKTWLQDFTSKTVELAVEPHRPPLEEQDGSLSPALLTEDFEGEVRTCEEDALHYSRMRSEVLAAMVEKCFQSRNKLESNPLLSTASSRFYVTSREKVVRGRLEQTVEDLMRLEVLKHAPIEDDEEEISECLDLKPILEDWRSKYRPRKPKFFVRVKSGYEWNKYNQTHYDHLNPPPKVVQGYKFNIFFPDLIDKSRAPQFYLEPDPHTTETCTIRFHAGPPYEDIAFRVVNREWEFSERHGFKNVFDRGILHVYYNFRRHRFKR